MRPPHGRRRRATLENLTFTSPGPPGVLDVVTSCHGADLPFGGFKESGVGRQNGPEGFEQHLEAKAVAWPLA